MNAGEAMQQGKTYLESGEYELAAEAFTQAIRLDPQNAARITAAAMRITGSASTSRRLKTAAPPSGLTLKTRPRTTTAEMRIPASTTTNAPYKTITAP